MDSGKVELDHEFLPFLRVYKDGRVERLKGTEFVPPSIEAHPTASSKDVTINTETGLSARLYIPKTASTGRKLPLLIYIHGGGFLIESAFSPLYHNYINSLVTEANIVVVSVEYRLAPEHHLPVAYEDCWEAIQWVASHCDGNGNETWLSEHADFGRVFLAGDSAGGNIVHNMAMRAGEESNIDHMNMKFQGIILVHPYFWGEETIGSEGADPDRKAYVDRIWLYVCPSVARGNDDPRLNPVAGGAPALSKLACSRVLIFLAEKDVIRDRGWLYYESLKKSGWGGTVEIVEAEGEDHVFHLFYPTTDKAIGKMKRLASFINQES